MIAGRMIAIAVLFSAAGAVAGCATGGADSDRPRLEYYMSEEPAYHSFHHHVLNNQPTRTIAGYGSN